MSNVPKWNGRRLEFAAVLALLFVSTSINIGLARRLIAVGRPAGPAYAAVGTVLPSIELTTLDGKTDTINYSHIAKPTVLYVFSPDCPWCARNIENIRALAKAREGEFRFIGISMAQTQELSWYAKTYALGFPMYTVTESARMAYRLRTIPETIVVSQSGTVLQNWGGAYGDSNLKAIEQYFGVTLPGLLPSPPIAH